MSVVILVQVAGCDDLFRVNTVVSGDNGLRVWKDRDGIDLYWRGRRVEALYSMSLSSAYRWERMKLFDAMERLLENGRAIEVATEPTDAGEPMWRDGR